LNATDFNDASADPIDLRQYIYLLWHWAWLILLVAAMAGGAAFVVSKRQTPVYQAATTLRVNYAPGTSAGDYSSIMTSQLLASTYVPMMTTQAVLSETVRRLNVPLDPYQLKRDISIKPVNDTQLIQITVESTNPELAAGLANTLVAVFSDQVQFEQAQRFAASKQSLQNQMNDVDQKIQALIAQSARAADAVEKDRLENNLAQYRTIYTNLLTSFENVRLSEAQTKLTVSQLDPALAPGEPISPKVLQTTLLALIVGAMLAVGAIFLLEMLDDTIRDPEVLLKKYQLPILGVIAHHEQKAGTPIAQYAPRSPVAEAFRSLRTNVKYASVDKPLRSLLVTSPTPADGKSTISANLGVVMAQGGARVFIIDADLRRPAVHKMFGTHNRVGLSGLFVQAAEDGEAGISLNGAVQAAGTLQGAENVSVISSGTLPPNPAELLGSKKMGEILQTILQRCDVVVLDTPPVLSVTDAVVLAPVVDGVILVIKAGTTKQAAFKQALIQLNQVGANLLGVVINEVGVRGNSYNYYYRKYYQDHYGYRNAYAKQDQPKKGNIFGKRSPSEQRERPPSQAAAAEGAASAERTAPEPHEN
jgi:non-specific protein-tyrosine kinase